MKPKYDYLCQGCKMVVFEREMNESHRILPCPVCEDRGDDRLQLFKKIYHVPNATRVWHGHMDLTTGEYVTDYKKWKQLLKDNSKERSDRLGIEHDFVEVSASDQNLGVTDDGLDSTHNRAVESGQKDSKGRFVFTMKD